jgi:hypothetical protein
MVTQNIRKNLKTGSVGWILQTFSFASSTNMVGRTGSEAYDLYLVEDGKVLEVFFCLFTYDGNIIIILDVFSLPKIFLLKI